MNPIELFQHRTNLGWKREASILVNSNQHAVRVVSQYAHMITGRVVDIPFVDVPVGSVKEGKVNWAVTPATDLAAIGAYNKLMVNGVHSLLPPSNDSDVGDLPKSSKSEAYCR